MKRTLFSLVFIFSLLSVSFGSNATIVNVSDKTEKLTVTQRVKIMTKHLQLTTEEQTKMTHILKSTQQSKETIKASADSEKDKALKVDKIKEAQKANIKKLLGKSRYEKYKALKKKDVF